MKKFFASKQKFRDEPYELIQNLLKLNMNSLYGVQIRKDSFEPFKCKSQNWMETENDDNALFYWKSPKGNCIVKLKNTLV